MRVYFIRHGETDWNKMEKIQGRVDNPLNESGKMQSQKAREIVKDVAFTHAYASTLSRAKQTAEIILEGRNLTIMQDERLLERDFGALEGMRHEAYYEFASEKEMPVSVERAGSIYTRVEAFFSDLVAKHDENDVILVSAHAHTIRTWTERTFPEHFDFSTRLYNCQAIIIDYVNDGYQFGGITERITIEEE